MKKETPVNFGDEHAEAIAKALRNKRKSLENFIPDFFEMDEEKRIEHIFHQQSADYLIKLKGKLKEHISNDSRRAYYENQIYRRIYDLVLK